MATPKTKPCPAPALVSEQGAWYFRRHGTINEFIPLGDEDDTKRHVAAGCLDAPCQVDGVTKSACPVERKGWRRYTSCRLESIDLATTKLLVTLASGGGTFASGPISEIDTSAIPGLKS